MKAVLPSAVANLSCVSASGELDSRIGLGNHSGGLRKSCDCEPSEIPIIQRYGKSIAAEPTSIRLCVIAGLRMRTLILDRLVVDPRSGEAQVDQRHGQDDREQH